MIVSCVKMLLLCVSILLVVMPMINGAAAPVPLGQYPGNEADFNIHQAHNDIIDMNRDRALETTAWAQAYFGYGNQVVMREQLLAVASLTCASERLDGNSVFELLFEKAHKFIIPRPQNVEIICALAMARGEASLPKENNWFKKFQCLYLPVRQDLQDIARQQAERWVNEFWARNAANQMNTESLRIRVANALAEPYGANVAVPAYGHIMAQVRRIVPEADNDNMATKKVILRLLLDHCSFKTFDYKQAYLNNASTNMNQTQSQDLQTYRCREYAFQNMNVNGGVVNVETVKSIVACLKYGFSAFETEAASVFANIVGLLMGTLRVNDLNLCPTINETAFSYVFENMIAAASNSDAVHNNFKHLVNELIPLRDLLQLSIKQSLMIVRCLAQYRNFMASEEQFRFIFFDVKAAVRSGQPVVGAFMDHDDSIQLLLNAVYEVILVDSMYGWKGIKVHEVSKNTFRIKALKMNRGDTVAAAINADLLNLATKLREVKDFAEPEVGNWFGRIHKTLFGYSGAEPTMNRRNADKDYPRNINRPWVQVRERTYFTYWNDKLNAVRDWVKGVKDYPKVEVNNVPTAVCFDSKESAEAARRIAEQKLLKEAKLFARHLAVRDAQGARKLEDAIGVAETVKYNYDYVFMLPKKDIRPMDICNLLIALLDEVKDNGALINSLLIKWGEKLVPRNAVGLRTDANFRIGLVRVGAVLQGTQFRRLLWNVMDIWMQNVGRFTQPKARGEAIMNWLLVAAQNEPSMMALFLAQHNRLDFELELSERALLLNVLLRIRDLDIDLDSVNYLLNCPVTERNELFSKIDPFVRKASKSNDAAIIIRSLWTPPRNWSEFGSSCWSPKAWLNSTKDLCKSLYYGHDEIVHKKAVEKPLDEKLLKHFALMTRRTYDDGQALKFANVVLEQAAREQIVLDRIKRSKDLGMDATVPVYDDDGIAKATREEETKKREKMMLKDLPDMDVKPFEPVWKVQYKENFASKQLRVLIATLALSGRSAQASALLEAWSVYICDRDETAVEGNKWFGPLATIASLTPDDLSDFNRVIVESMVLRIENGIWKELCSVAFSDNETRIVEFEKRVSEEIFAAAQDLMTTETKFGLFWWFINCRKVHLTLTTENKTTLLRAMLNDASLKKAPKKKALFERGLAILFAFDKPSLYATGCTTYTSTLIASALRLELFSERTVGRAVIDFYQKYMSTMTRWSMNTMHFLRSWIPIFACDRQFNAEEAAHKTGVETKKVTARQTEIQEAKKIEERIHAEKMTTRCWQWFNSKVRYTYNYCSGMTKLDILEQMSYETMASELSSGYLQGIHYLYQGKADKVVADSMRFDLLRVMCEKATLLPLAMKCMTDTLKYSTGNTKFFWTSSEIKEQMHVTGIPTVWFALVHQALHDEMARLQRAELSKIDKSFYEMATGIFKAKEVASVTVGEWIAKLEKTVKAALTPRLTVANHEEIGSLVLGLYEANYIRTLMFVLRVIEAECPSALSNATRFALLEKMVSREVLQWRVEFGGEAEVAYKFLLLNLSNSECVKLLHKTLTYDYMERNELHQQILAALPAETVERVRMDMASAVVGGSSNNNTVKIAALEDETDSESDSSSSEDEEDTSVAKKKKTRSSRKVEQMAAIYTLMKTAKGMAKANKRAKPVVGASAVEKDNTENSSGFTSLLDWLASVPGLHWVIIGTLLVTSILLVFLIVSMTSGWAVAAPVAGVLSGSHAAHAAIDIGTAATSAPVLPNLVIGIN